MATPELIEGSTLPPTSLANIDAAPGCAVACLRCRARRQFCSKERPQCKKCRDARADCVYKKEDAEEEIEGEQEQQDPSRQLTVGHTSMSFHGSGNANQFLQSRRKRSNSTATSRWSAYYQHVADVGQADYNTEGKSGLLTWTKTLLAPAKFIYETFHPPAGSGSRASQPPGYVPTIVGPTNDGRAFLEPSMQTGRPTSEIEGSDTAIGNPILEMKDNNAESEWKPLRERPRISQLLERARDMQVRLAEERRDGAKIARMNVQLQSMIEEGHRALGNPVVVEDDHDTTDLEAKRVNEDWVRIGAQKSENNPHAGNYTRMEGSRPQKAMESNSGSGAQLARYSTTQDFNSQIRNSNQADYTLIKSTDKHLLPSQSIRFELTPSIVDRAKNTAELVVPTTEHVMGKRLEKPILPLRWYQPEPDSVHYGDTGCNFDGSTLRSGGSTAGPRSYGDPTFSSDGGTLWSGRSRASPDPFSGQSGKVSCPSPGLYDGLLSFDAIHRRMDQDLLGVPFVDETRNIDDMLDLFELPDSPTPQTVQVEGQCASEDSSTDDDWEWTSDYSKATAVMDNSHPLAVIRDEIVLECLLAFHAWQQHQYHGELAGSSRTPVPKQDSGSAAETPAGHLSRKHRRQNEEGDEDDERHDQPGKKRMRNQRPMGPNRSLACPFAKKDPLKYRSCFAKTISRIQDVKLHLSRCHQPPLHCYRCKSIFGTEAVLVQHAEREFQCLPQREPIHEGLTRNQKDQLKRRISAKMTLEQQWYAIFDILFPNHQPRPLSPYVDTRLELEIRSFHEMMMVEGPGIISRALDSNPVPLSTRDTEEDLATLRESVIAEALQAITERWLAVQCPDPEPSHDPRSSSTDTDASTQNLAAGDDTMDNSRATSGTQGTTPGVNNNQDVYEWDLNSFLMEEYCQPDPANSGVWNFD